MSSCEKCWADAGGDPDEYRRLLKERDAIPCTPEEHAGPDATTCPACGRRAVHQWAKTCVACTRAWKGE